MANETGEFSHIVRIAGVDIRGDYLLPFALTKIRGVGSRLSLTLIQALQLPKDLRIGFLTDAEIEKIENALDNPKDLNVPDWMLNRQRDPVTGENHHVYSNDLAIALKNDLDRMKKTQSIKGIRHQLGLTVRGQRTRTSGRKSGKSVGVSKRRGN